MIDMLLNHKYAPEFSDGFFPVRKDRRRLSSIPLDHVPHVHPLEHTMTHSLISYIEGKIASSVVDEISATRRSVLVAGFTDEFDQRQIAPSAEQLRFSYVSGSKELNFIRPKWMNLSDARDPEADTLLIKVFPGYDYTRHVASLIYDAMRRRVSSAGKLLSVAWEPAAEINLAHWTGLKNIKVCPDSTIVLGFVEALVQEAGADAKLVFENSHYKAWCIGTRVYLLGCKFSFWGRLAARIVRHLCCTNDVGHVIYFGKLGTFTSPSDLYDRIFSPNTYVTASGAKIMDFPFSIPNPITEKYRDIQTVCHASVPTIVEETFDQRDLLSAAGVQTIDNEIAFIAREIRRYNSIGQRQVKFSPFHYATDYVRDRREWYLETPFDLSRGREPLVLLRRSSLKKRMAHMLLDFLSTEK